MILNRAYIKVDNLQNRNTINEMILETFNDPDIDWNDSVGKITTMDEQSFQLSLSKILSLAIQDFNFKISILIVPFFDDLFVKYLDYSTNNVFTLFDVLIKTIDNLTTQKDIKIMYSRFSKKDVDTIKAFMSCNGNIKLAASELFLHRNSLNYRLNQFMEKTSIDIRDVNSIMFLNLIISYCS